MLGTWPPGAFAPSRGRELKFVSVVCRVQIRQFAPSRGRELKWGGTQRLASAPRFAPSRGRELKLEYDWIFIDEATVRPLTGAGIEISAEAAYPAWL